MEPQDSQQPQTTTPESPANTPAPAPNNSPTTTAPDSPKPTKKGYGKRPIWQWVVIYVVLAIIVYGLIYLLVIHKSGGTGSKGYGY